MTQVIKDDDLMLVGRKGQTYKVTGKEVHDFFEDYVDPIPPEIESVELYQQYGIGQFVAPLESSAAQAEFWVPSTSPLPAVGTASVT